MVAEQVKKQKDYENEAREAAAETDKKVKELQAEADAIAKLTEGKEENLDGNSTYEKYKALLNK